MSSRHSFRFCLGLLTAATILHAAERLPRENLLLFHDDAGVVRKVQTKADWQRRRAEILNSMQSVMGPLPAGVTNALKPRVLEEADCGTYVRRLITYESEPGMPVPAYLCVPKSALAGKSKAPAILCLHPTDNRVGHKVVVGLGGRANRQYAQELAERGYFTLSPSYPLLANYQPDLQQSVCASGTMKAIHDNRRGLDLLATLPFVETSRGFGVIGHSLGGHNSIYTAVFDERIKAIASSCGFDSYLDYYDGADRVWHYGKGWCQDRYMAKLADYRGRLEEIPFDFHEMIGSLAPRPFFVNAPLGDSNFRWRSVDRVIKAARDVYRLFDATDRIEVEHPDCTHDFPEAMRKRAYEMFDRVLRGQ